MASFEQTFQLNVPSSTAHQAIIRDFVDKVGQRAGFDENQVQMLTLAVDEAVANVIEHAYRMDPSKAIQVHMVVDDEEVKIDIIDTGEGFDPSGVRQKGLDQLVAERRSGGLGLRLIRTIMDDVQYRIVPGEKNELRMVKKLPKKQ